MAGNFDGIGVPSRLVESFVTAVVESVQRTGSPGRCAFWNDPSGAALALCLDGNLLDGEGEMVTRCTLQWLPFRPWSQGLRRPRETRVRVVPFAQGLGLSGQTDESAFRSGAGTPIDPASGGPSVGLSTEAFLPTAMFGAAEQGSVMWRATAMFGGRILRSTRQWNEGTGMSFRHLVVEALPGAVDVVAPDAPGGGGAPGSRPSPSDGGSSSEAG